MIVLYTQNLIVATALPGLNTRPAKSPLLFLLGGGSKAEVYSKALPQIRSYPLLQKPPGQRGYVTDKCKISKNNSNNINNNNGCSERASPLLATPSLSLPPLGNPKGRREGSFIDYFWSSIVCLIFLLFIYYMFESYFIFIITFYFSFLVSLYISDNFKYSNLYFIRFAQRIRNLLLL